MRPSLQNQAFNEDPEAMRRIRAMAEEQVKNTTFARGGNPYTHAAYLNHMVLRMLHQDDHIQDLLRSMDKHSEAFMTAGLAHVKKCGVGRTFSSDVARWNSESAFGGKYPAVKGWLRGPEPTQHPDSALLLPVYVPTV